MEVTFPSHLTQSGLAQKPDSAISTCRKDLRSGRFEGSCILPVRRENEPNPILPGCRAAGQKPQNGQSTGQGHKRRTSRCSGGGQICAQTAGHVIAIGNRKWRRQRALAGFFTVDDNRDIVDFAFYFQIIQHAGRFRSAKTDDVSLTSPGPAALPQRSHHPQAV